jgi:Cu+-exporting ATPase
VSPLDKHSEIARLQSEGRKVAVLGEDARDALTISQADIGIAFASGPRVTQENADIILMRSDLMDVPAAIQIGQRTAHNMHDNLFWAFGYHVVGIAIAAGLLHVFGGPLLNPVLAAATMILGIASVLISTIRPKRFEPYLSESLPAKKSSGI